MKTSVVALVDCNSFYASCEKVFNPKLTRKPVIVLSNNDGCVVARSREAKQVGVKMAIPIFKINNLVKRYDIQVFSSNYALYADMSERVMSVLSQFTQEVEVYSIDEAFLNFGNNFLYDECLGKEIHDRVEKWTGVPISVGIASTKTLAKIANEVCKKDPSLSGYLDITKLTSSEIDYYLQQIEVYDVWGVGRQYTKYLNSIGIKNARDLKYANTRQIRKHMTVMGERTVRELNGQACIELETTIKPKKVIACTRAFSRDVYSYKDLNEAVASYAARASEKLRHDNSVANFIYVFIITNRFKKEKPQYFKGVSIKLPFPTAYAPIITKYAIYCLQHIFKPRYAYKKAGVFLMGIESANIMQYDMLYPSKESDRIYHSKLMATIDNINKKWGRNTIHMASQGIERTWGMKQAKRSPRYTTCWEEIPVVMKCN